MASISRPPGKPEISPYLLLPLRTLEQAQRDHRSKLEHPNGQPFEPREWPSPDYLAPSLAAPHYRGPVAVQNGATYAQPQAAAGNANAPARDESFDAPIFL